jgi:amino acid adenylation domain-containing protein
MNQPCQYTAETVARGANQVATQRMHDCDPTKRIARLVASVPDLVSAQAEATPNSAAVVMPDEVLTYGELNARAKQIANLLRSDGAGPETLVGVCMERSASMIVAELGVLKSGAAYLPLDPSYPEDHLAFVLHDARPLVLLTQHRLSGRLPKGEWRTIEVEFHELKPASQSAEWTNNGFTGQNLAYVIYTSGSTGRPKGVQIAHDSLSNLILWHQQAFSIKPTDRATQLASPGFDAAVWELWPYLTAGASVHIVDDAMRGDPVALRNWLVEQRITIAFVPTPMAERMIALQWPSDTTLRILLTGADTLHQYPPAGLPFTLINNYGPTECTVVASSGPVFSNERPANLPPIGRTITNAQIYILNEEMHQVPIGASGEIYIGGAGVARGYLNRPELTRERFIPNPFSHDANALLYRTGDLARYLPDGQIEFLGRLDDQVKIRGYRIEPNEIVMALNQHPSVLASALVAREDSRGEKYLVAYLVLDHESQSTAAAIRDSLRERLPAHMVPSVFVRLESLPLTSNGKIDRANLPAPDTSNTTFDSAYTMPRTILERRVSGILAKLLDIDRIGVHDNLFLLGGHSLLAAQLIGSVRDMFDIELPLRTIFDSPTVAGLSQKIKESLMAKVNSMTHEEVRRTLSQLQG